MHTTDPGMRALLQVGKRELLGLPTMCQAAWWSWVCSIERERVCLFLFFLAMLESQNRRRKVGLPQGDQRTRLDFQFRQGLLVPHESRAMARFGKYRVLRATRIPVPGMQSSSRIFKVLHDHVFVHIS